MTSDYKRKALFAILLPALAFILTGCSGTPVKPPKNNDIDILADNALNIDTLPAKNIKVAADKSWQSSGILLDNGEHIKVKATGKWSPAPLIMQWSGGEGNSFFGSEVPYITGGALMAKLGHDGTPFEIGINKTFQANDYGMLYLAMNDPFKWQYDNEGALDVSIYTSNSKSSDTATAKRPTEIVAYDYDEKSGKGSLSAKVASDHFLTRNWMIKKIGEIASSKRVALLAGKESLQGGSYKVLDESSQDGILTIKFETLW
jgi:hypothetical protein